MNRQFAAGAAFAGALALGLSLHGAPAAAQAEPSGPLEIRLISGIPTATIFAMMPAKKDILRNFGKDYTLQMRRIDASSEVAMVLAGGAADMGFTATGALISVNTKLKSDLRIVADVLQNGVKGYNGNWFVVRADDPIKDIKDLKGRTVATLGFGSFVDIAMRIGIKTAGLDPAKDLTIVQVPYPAMEANLREKKVDMVQFVPPFFQIARAKGGVRVVFTAAEVLGPVQALMLAARADFLQKNPRRVQAFFDDYYRFLQYALDPKNRDEMIEIGAKMQSIPPDRFRPWWNTQEDFFRSPDGLPNVEAIKKEMQLLKDFGIIDALVDIDRWVNLSFMRTAAANFRR